MKLNAVALACAATLVFAAGASAQTVIEEHPNGVVVQHDHPSVTIQKDHPAVVEKKSIETTGSGGCDSKTVHKETDYGSKTVKKTNCE